MKIDADLRQAVRHVCAQQSHPGGWELRRKQNLKAIAALFQAKPEVAREARRHSRGAIAAAAKMERHRDELRKLGLNTDLDRITDESRFKKLGGRLEDIPGPLRFERVMAQLAMASEKEGKAILRRLKIKWKGITE